MIKKFQHITIFLFVVMSFSLLLSGCFEIKKHNTTEAETPYQYITQESVPWEFNKETNTLHLKTDSVYSFKDRSKNADILAPNKVNMGQYAQTVILASEQGETGRIFYIIPEKDKLALTAEGINVVIPEDNDLINFLTDPTAPSSLFFIIAGYDTTKLQKDNAASINYALTAKRARVTPDTLGIKPTRLTLEIENPMIKGIGFEGNKLLPIDRSLSLEDFAQEWGNKESGYRRTPTSFAKKPPTTFITGQTADGNVHQYVMNISMPTIKGDVIIFDATLTHINGKVVEAAQPVMLSNAVVFVDSCGGMGCLNPNR